MDLTPEEIAEIIYSKLSGDKTPLALGNTETLVGSYLPRLREEYAGLHEMLVPYIQQLVAQMYNKWLNENVLGMSLEERQTLTRPAGVVAAPKKTVSMRKLNLKKRCQGVSTLATVKAAGKKARVATAETRI